MHNFLRIFNCCEKQVEVNSINNTFNNRYSSLTYNAHEFEVAVSLNNFNELFKKILSCDYICFEHANGVDICVGEMYLQVVASK